MKLAQRIGCTEGQLYTMAISLTVAVVLAVAGIPAVLRDRPAAASAAGLTPLRDNAAAPASSAPQTTPTTPVTARPPAAVANPPRSSSSAPGTGGSEPAPNSPGTATVPPGGIATPIPPLPGTITVFARLPAAGPPGGVAVAPDGSAHVTTANAAGPLRLYSFDGSGAATANREIRSDHSDRAAGLAGVAIHPDGATATVLDHDRALVIDVNLSSGAQTVRATIPDLPACLLALGADRCQDGIEDRPPAIVAATYDQSGNLYVTDPAQDTIWRLVPGSDVAEPWLQSQYLRLGAGPYGLAGRDGAFFFTAGTTLDPAALNRGALYRVPIESDGSAGEMALVYAFTPDAAPGSLAAGRTGDVFVVLRGSGAIVAVASDGSTTHDLVAAGGVPGTIDAPIALAVAPGKLLVANGFAGSEPARWSVLAIALDVSPTLEEK